MAWYFAYTPSIWLSSLIVLLFIAPSIYNRRQRSALGAWSFNTVCLYADSWTAGLMMEIAAAEKPSIGSILSSI